jgi:hypothetical protein
MTAEKPFGLNKPSARVFAAVLSQACLPDLHADVVSCILGATVAFKTYTRVSIADGTVVRNDGNWNSRCASIEYVSRSTVEDGVHTRPILPTFLACSAENVAINCTVQFILRAVELHEEKQSLERR